MTIIVSVVTSCKDEINLPEYGGYVDGDSPTIEILSPREDAVLDASKDVNFAVRVRDDFEVSEITVRLIPGDISFTGFEEVVEASDTLYTYTKNFTLPTTDSMQYEVNISATDFVGNSQDKVYFFTAK